MPQLTLPPLAIDAGDSGGPVYTSGAIRSALGSVLAGGTTPGRARTGALGMGSFQVALSGSTVTAAPGGYAIATAAGTYISALTSTFTVGTLTPADATNPRTDLVVLRIDDPSNGGTTDRAGAIEILTGTPAASPVRPSVTGTSVYALLAQIAVPRSGGGSPVVTDLRTWTAGTGGVVPFRTTTEINSWAAPSGTLAYSLSDNKTYIRQGANWKNLQVEEDTGWVTLTPAADYILFGASPIQIRMRNGVVQLMGTVKPKVAGPLDSKIIVTVPTIYRGSWVGDLVTVHQGSSTNKWITQVSASGAVKADRYGVTAYVDAGTSSWLPFNMVWLV